MTAGKKYATRRTNAIKTSTLTPAVETAGRYPSISTVPEHVAIIMDGNGRWAREHTLPRIEGHRRGARTLFKVAKAARSMGIRYLTLYAFSVENWQRPHEEVGALMAMLEQFLERATPRLIKNQTRLKMIGRLDGLPERVQSLLEESLAASAHFDQCTLTLALNYGARTEIIDAIQAYTRSVQAGKEDPDTLDWPTFARYLYTSDLPDPDLLIRTSGETRLSNFLLTQCAYSELYFTPTLWPDFTGRELEQAIEQFNQRERRFGKTSEQMGAAKPTGD